MFRQVNIKFCEAESPYPLRFLPERISCWQGKSQWTTFLLPKVKTAIR